MLWEIDIHPRSGQPNKEAKRANDDITELNLANGASINAARGYLLQAESLNADDVARLADELFVDSVVETAVVAQVGDDQLNACPTANGQALQLVHVMPKAGVMDPVAQSAMNAMEDSGVSCTAIRTFRKYWLSGVDSNQVEAICNRVLANDAIEQAIVGPLEISEIEAGSEYKFELKTVAIESLDDDGLMKLSKEGQLYLQLAEMQTIQKHFADLGRAPTDIELETLAQTWSEHCSHKTLAGRIAYKDENGERHFENMLKETIFEATQSIRRKLGDKDWCVSVFKDNAGIVRFDEKNNLAFKVETHNHPSALEPYGGANTGIGGVIRDIMGTGLGAKPIASTDVFCFAPPNTDPKDLPPGTLHPRRVMRGVVEGVRDYGNRMGIPTINGAICFDERYLGNPLVYCGSIGILPHEMSFKETKPNDFIVAMGGRTGRDGIHGATFSSAELTSESESLSGGSVQIGNAIEEKKVLDVLLTARDQNLYTAVTDCGAGGFSSAVGEMGEELGAEVWLDRAPLKYNGLSYTEIWISEAQERMVFSVPEENVEKLIELCKSENVEAFVLGQFTPTGRLVLKYNDTVVGDLPMSFMHDGRPPVVRSAAFNPPKETPSPNDSSGDQTETLLNILGSLNVASKEWVIRQYDHEVQGGSVVKPLVGVENDGPSDASVFRPVLGSKAGATVACGINPHYGDLDPYHMAASAIDEAIRNCIAVGADPERIALLDNFCWGDCEREETLGGLVRAAIACHDLAVAFDAPFVSGKDSLNNEFSFTDADGNRQTIAIPPTLLITALGQMDDVTKCVTMDLKKSGNHLYLVGQTKNELGGSHFHLVRDEATTSNGCVPKVDTDSARKTYQAIHAAINQQLIRACHDLSEGGLAVAATEMCFAGGLGAEISLANIPCDDNASGTDILLFSESNTRFLCEVAPENAADFEKALSGIAFANIGTVTEFGTVQMNDADGNAVIQTGIQAAKAAWQKPLDW